MATLICELDNSFIKTNLKTEIRINEFKGLVTRWFVNGQSATGHERGFQSTRLRLPVNVDVVDFLKIRKVKGDTILLHTALDEAQVRETLPEHEIFDDIIQQGNTNTERSLCGVYDYLGTSSTPLSIWQKASKRYVVEDSNQTVTNSLHEHKLSVEQSFKVTPPRVQSFLRALRPHQWLKNILVFAPLIASQQMMNTEPLIKSVIMFLCFSMVASFGYIINDILDIQSDRTHLEKRLRPFASGELQISHGVILAFFLLTVAASIGVFLSGTSIIVLLAYLVLTLSYSVFLKTKLMLDVVILGTAFTLRVMGGAAAIESELSFYLLSFSIFLFASLGMLKRYAELLSLQKQQKLNSKGRGYRVEDMAPVRTIGISMGTMSVFILGQYINSPLIAEFYTRPILIWLLLPLLLYWLGRLWLLANRGGVTEDPLLFAVKDRVSQMTFLASVLILALAD